MYLSHFSLERQPFSAVADSRFFYPTEAHENALAAISYAVCEGGEPVLLCGMPGCGKTLVLRTLRRQLPQERFHVAFVPETSGAEVGLLQRVAYHLTHKVAGDAIGAMEIISGCVEQAQGREQSVVIMLDDWPVDAGESMFDPLRWLLNVDGDSGSVCVLLSGEPFDPWERWPGWLAQRLFTVARLTPAFGLERVQDYLVHRLRAAGHADGKLFAPEAVERISEWSEGVPRLVNRVAHLALHVAFLNLAERVEEDAVQQAIGRLSRFEAPKAAAEVAG
jgi:MSHA biogenesis protein MshM